MDVIRLVEEKSEIITFSAYKKPTKYAFIYRKIGCSLEKLNNLLMISLGYSDEYLLFSFNYYV